MSNRTSQIVILCEDTQQESFIRRFLKKAHGIESNLLRVVKNPGGKGSEEQFVRKCSPIELNAMRRRNAKTTAIAAIDADLTETSERIRQLNIACKRAGIEPTISNDNVASVIPKRNIGTWIAWQNGQSVDETTAYPGLSNESDCQPAVEKLYDHCTQNITLPDFPDSLAKACVEYHKVKRSFSA